jgi:hypothetical protein
MRALVAVGLASLLLSACDQSEERGERRASSVREEQVPEPRANEVPEDRYRVTVDAPARTATGREVLAKVIVEPRAPWHMNLEFPVSLELRTPDGVVVVGAQQRKDDVERLDEQGLVFAVPFTANSQGAKQFEGELKFAVCGDEACSPISVPVSFMVEVA